ncbi:clathrin coat assembly protein AP180 [Aristolochia californica]|uniref:clathrin coat assembly protein AP180 n=1 Tax=Aristolochia californica TaxID=171875 RepID=UPI0035D5C82C
MPSKLRKALGAVKDQTSISLAKVSGTNFANLDVAILKATTHDDVPVEEKFLTEVVLLTTTSRTHAAACVRYLRRRISRTKNWIVALKALNLVFRILQEGDPHFCHEVLRAMKRGSCLLDLSYFRDDSNSCPWDYTAFVRIYALYLTERLECSLMGKLHQSRTKARNSQRLLLQQQPPQGIQRRRSLDSGQDAKPVVLLDKIVYWQRLLDRVLVTKPTGPARINRLVQISLYLIVRESFEIYREISDGLALVLDNFFHLPKHACVEAFHTCSKSSKQFDELGVYYTFCKSLGVGRSSEYPSVQKISDTLLETLNEFLKDNTHPSHLRSSSVQTVKPNPDSFFHQAGSPSQGTSTTSVTGRIGDGDIDDDEGTELDYKSTQPSENDDDEDEDELQRARGSSASEQHRISLIDIDDGKDVTRTSVSSSTTTTTTTTTPESNSVLDLGALDDEQQEEASWQAGEQRQGHKEGDFEPSCSNDSAGWEMALVESANNLAHKLNSINHRMIDPSFVDDLFDKGSPFHQNNPFLEMDNGSSTEYDSFFSSGSPLPFPAPTFRANNPDISTLPPEADPFSSSYCVPSQPVEQISSPSINQDLMFQSHPQFSL